MSKAPFFRIRGSDDGDDPCGAQQSSIEATTFNPVFVKILCNNTPQEALIDTGSAITIIHKQVLNKIPHKQFIEKTKNHLSASCSTVNIIGEISLEIKIGEIITTVVADVATDLVTNLILGNDWIQANKVYIMTPEKRIMIKQRGKEVSARFVNPPRLNYSAIIINHITIPPFSERLIEAQVTHGNENMVLFEPNIRLRRKALFTPNALLSVEDDTIKINIINETNPLSPFRSTITNV